MSHETDSIFQRHCFVSSRRRQTRFDCDWSSDVCSSDLIIVSPRSLGETAKAVPSIPRTRREPARADPQWIYMVSEKDSEEITLTRRTNLSGIRTVLSSSPHFCPSSAMTSLTNLKSMYSSAFFFGFVPMEIACHWAISSTPCTVGTGFSAARIRPYASVAASRSILRCLTIVRSEERHVGKE